MATPYPRRRKVALLSLQGFKKLQTAIAQSHLWNPHTKSCTLEKLSEHTGISTQTLSKVHARRVVVDLRTLVRYFDAFHLTLDLNDYCLPAIPAEPVEVTQVTEVDTAAMPPLPQPDRSVSWGRAPDVSEFCGRTTELTTLRQWIVEHQCRLIALLGMGGIGKTWLAAKIAEQVQAQFTSVIWRSLKPITAHHRLTPFNEFLDDLLHHLTDSRAFSASQTVEGKMRLILDILREKACLLVFDNFESVLLACNSIRHDTAAHNDLLADCQAYAEFLQQLGQVKHRSCVILTSRIEPKIVLDFVGKIAKVRSWTVQGLEYEALQRLLRRQGEFCGSASDWQQLIELYDANPLMLGYVGKKILRFFEGNIATFLHHDVRIFDEFGELLAQQLKALPKSGQVVIKLLASQDKPLSLSGLRSSISPSISEKDLLETLAVLKARSIIPKPTNQYVLSPLLKDYVKAEF
jgi:transcriptional regulator with XRE-family HTH domain